MYNDMIKRSQDRLLKRSICRSKIYLTKHGKCISCKKKTDVKSVIKQLQKENV